VLIAALLMVILIPLVAGSVRVLQPGTVGLVERLGRVIPVVRQPGLVLLIPFLERLLTFPSKPFEMELELEVELSGRMPLKLSADCTCEVADVMKFHESLPFTARGSMKETMSHESQARAREFLRGLLESEGRAVVREMGLMEFLGDEDGCAERVMGRLQWHTKRVGLRVEKLVLQAAEMSPEAMWQLRKAVDEERARRGEEPPAES
jgi:regulator of protease activity HflC (stomatin/prohibitin superfamily)